jgi:antibiotic biosynthesis monooxygenase
VEDEGTTADLRARQADVQPVWTVDTWRVRPGREQHFLDRCQALSPDPLILYRDAEEPALFWSPAKWESREALKRWRDSAQYLAAVRSLEDDVEDHQTHVMMNVPGFLPRASSNDAAHAP